MRSSQECSPANSTKTTGNAYSEISAKTDTDLLADVVDGNHSAFSELMIRYKAPLFHYIFRYVGDASTAEDLLQDVFVSIYSKAASYDQAWKPSTWIYRIALNKCRDHGRKQRLRKFISLDQHSSDEGQVADAPLAIDPNPDVEHIIIHRQELKRFEKILSNMPHKMRTAVVLHLIEGRRQAECAEILGVSRKSIEMLVYRARKILREKLYSEAPQKYNNGL